MNPSIVTGVDTLCLIRIFTRGYENLIGTYFAMEKARKGDPIDFRLDSRTLRELEKRRRRHDVQVELILMILARYEDGTGGEETLMAQVGIQGIYILF